MANDSHGDATRAFFDKDYTFIGVLVDKDKDYYIEPQDLSKFFVMKKGIVDLEKVIFEMKGQNINTKQNITYLEELSN